jgi:ABC-type Fe3+ transport system substrate-binding protein
MQSKKSPLVVSRRTALKGAGAALMTMPFIAPTARAATTVTVLGGPGIHQELWRRWAEMVQQDTKGELQILYNPLGYTAAFSRLQTEQATKRIASDLFYGNAPFPEQAAVAGLTEGVPFDQLPNTQQLYPFARKPYGLSVFQFNWGIVGYNTNLVKKEELKGQLSLEEFTDPRWKGKVGWVDPRTFPFWIPMAVETYGEDKWIDWARRLDKNVQSYYNGWVNNRIALQRGEVSLTLHNASSVYVSAVVDKAAVHGQPLSQPKPSWCPMPVTVSLVKGTPRREAALRVVDLISSARYSNMLMEVGVNPSNNPANYPNPVASKMMEQFDGPAFGLSEWHDVEPWVLQLDWIKWVGQLKKYNTIWEDEVLKRRG